MPLRLVIVVLPLAASLGLALMAFYSPVKSLSALPSACAIKGDGVRPNAGLAAYCSTAIAERALDAIPFQAYQSYAEMAEGFAVVAFLCLLVSILKVPGFLKRRVAVPKVVRVASLSVVLVGLGVFAYAEFFNVLYAYTFDPQFFRLFNRIPDAPVSAFLGLVAACACLGALRAKEGLFEGLKSSVMLGGLSIFVAQLCLLLFDYREMYLNAAHFALWSIGGVWLVSNWFLLITSSFFTLLSLVPLLSRKAGVGR